MPQVPRERAWMSGSGRGAPSAWPSWARAPANAAAQSNGTPRSLASALTNGCDRAFLIGACALVAGVALAQLLPSGGRAAAGIGARVTAQAEPVVDLRDGEGAWAPSEA